MAARRERLVLLQRLVLLDLAVEMAASEIALLLRDGPCSWTVTEQRLSVTLTLLNDQRAQLDMHRATLAFTKHPTARILPPEPVVLPPEEPLLVLRTPSTLTDRDLEMLVLLADGMTLEAVGTQMGLPVGTVRSAMKAMKLRAGNDGSTTALVATGLRQGWIA
jgi:DNA-binding CsgD family transcriptional regulator